MAGLVLFTIIFLFVVITAISKSAGVASLDRIARTGMPGRALVLASTNFTQGMTINGRRYLRRVMTLEVEVWGQAPYVIPQGTFLVPRNLVEPLPGSSLEVAVDRKNPQNVAILGPGGFTGPWLNVGPPNPF